MEDREILEKLKEIRKEMREVDFIIEKQANGVPYYAGDRILGTLSSAKVLCDEIIGSERMQKLLFKRRKEGS